ncbi:DUF3757 domain-containing protein [Arsenophonus nasoniae]|uniref:DUF3757 domain-containing protein n=2 Tax=Arsenophonus nasoniae TaxID=638 RepID=D2TVS2_9GAMM|nr:DUF3757 domain-containing protein [Arsenophonus nasoniae]QBY42879.1 hypothetical protein ArsFIN_14400 [Arsenophonus nasoniae]WGL96205.1 DUF3757 domain-containing protein [Arsenophonus nasoniae]WGM02693.1 DUF3757 domain-containing protein [Arsenophonus nasoniae]WGM06938.1 DUF3757 domain-containing protein [Arsenophonus nasoniae]WGM11819.1 DUF3757 domain-containing protein [Arsenophonus nasoniae]
MKKLITLIIAASLIGFSLTSQATENCPALNKIESSNGIFHANGVDGNWLGVLQGIIAEKTTVQSFEGGLAIAESQSAPIKFQYCTYRVGVDKTLDMRFTPKNEKEFTIQTVGNLWKEEAGPFGLIYKVCEKTAPENCKFTIRQ